MVLALCSRSLLPTRESEGAGALRGHTYTKFHTTSVSVDSQIGSIRRDARLTHNQSSGKENCTSSEYPNQMRISLMINVLSGPRVADCWVNLQLPRHQMQLIEAWPRVTDLDLNLQGNWGRQIIAGNGPEGYPTNKS